MKWPFTVLASCFVRIVVVLVVAAQVVAATPANAQPITLDALVADTVARNPELEFYEHEIAAARGGRLTAGQWDNPELSTEYGRKDVHDLRGNHLGDGPLWSVSISQTFEFPGRLGLRKALANRQIELAEIGLEQFRAGLATRARSLGYALMAATQRAEAAAEVAQRFQDLRAVLVQREPAGVAPLLETRIIEASAFILSRRASEASIAMQSARDELNQLRGDPVGTPIAVARTTVSLPTPPPLERLLADARERNFDVRVRIAELQQQGLRVELSRNERWPAVKIGPFVAGERGSDTELRFGLGVTVPLPVANQNVGSIETAKARQSQAEVALKVAMRDVERRVATTLHGYQTFLAEMARWPSGVVQTFRDAARVGDEHYRLGALPIATYTELQTKYLDAVDALLGTQADALEARQQLELLTGTRLTDLSPPPPARSSASPASDAVASAKKAKRQ